MQKLLVIDDSPDMTFMLKVLLQKKGYIVHTLTNPVDVFQEVKKFEPDLLMVDIHLNGYDGKELCKELRAMPENKHLAILALSANPSSLSDFKSYYADAALEKPFNSALLLDKVSTLLTAISMRKKAFEEIDTSL